MIITIGRMCGCQGDTIGQALADEYHIPFWNKQELYQMAKEKDILQRYPDFFGEAAIDTFRHSICASEDGEILHKTPGQALGQLIGDKEGVILGRCGSYAFRKRTDVVRVFLVGEQSAREKIIAGKHDISTRKAAAVVAQTDERRCTYHQYYTGENWGEAKDYDLCLNVTQLGVDGVIALVKEYVRRMQSTI